jgi:flavin reductase (DIM6/NTAB) family NADH-FMN oxidoreductase RutF
MSISRLPLKKHPLNRAFCFFESGPVLLVSTMRNGQSNIMTISCHMSMGFTPLVGCMIGPWNHSYNMLIETGECVLSVPGVDLLETVVAIGNTSGADIDKFAEFGLTPRKGSKVGAPLIAECLASVECVVRERPGHHEMFVLEGVAAWHNTERKEQRTFHARGDGHFIIDGETVNLRDKMVKWQDCI